MTALSFDQLSDQELLVQVRRAAVQQREATARLVALLVELDARRLYLAEGCSSLFTYCTQVLHLSEFGAYNRIEAARAAGRFPTILQHLAEGSVNLTTIKLLSPHLTETNHAAVLDEARHKSKREIEHMVAALRPRPDVPSVIRKLPETKPIEGAGTIQVAAVVAQAADSGPSSNPMVGDTRPISPAEAGREPTAVKPLAPERYKIQFTVNRETYDDLRRAQDLLRHVVPDGDPAVIFERALKLLVRELSRARIGAVERPRPLRAKTGSTRRTRHIPAAVKRAVWKRDGGRCAFKGTEGRCAETGFLEFHHLVPFGAGGPTVIENIELRCRAHNAHEAELYFGSARSSGPSPAVLSG